MPSGVYPRKPNSALAIARKKFLQIQEENERLISEVESLRASGLTPADPLVVAALRLARADIVFKGFIEETAEGGWREENMAREAYFAAQDAFIKAEEDAAKSPPPPSRGKEPA